MLQTPMVSPMPLPAALYGMTRVMMAHVMLQRLNGYAASIQRGAQGPSSEPIEEAVLALDERTKT